MLFIDTMDAEHLPDAALSGLSPAAMTVETNEPAAVSHQEDEPGGIADPIKTASVLPENDDGDRLAGIGSPQLASIPPILNDRLAALADIGSTSKRYFHCFQNLPAEIRFQAWSHALQRLRLIRIQTLRLTPAPLGSSTGANHAYTGRNTLGNIVSSVQYTFKSGAGSPWESRKFPSALMAVNVEARQAALEFYYIKIPAAERIRSPNADAAIYLNPDWDYVRFLNRTPTQLLDFLWDMRAYDPKGRGIKHWVVGFSETFGVTRPDLLSATTTQSAPFSFNSRISRPSPLQDWPCPDKAAMGSLLANLETVTFMHRDPDSSRLCNSRWSHFDYLNERHDLLPVNARPHTFDFLDSDPRPGLSDALTTLWVKQSPVQVRRTFDILLSYFGVTRGPRTTLYHMVSVSPSWKHSDGREDAFISDRDKFLDLLQSDVRLLADDEADENREIQALLSLGDSSWIRKRPLSVVAHWDDELRAAVAEQRESNERMGLPPVVVPPTPPVERVAGFWLFPTEDFVGEEKGRTDPMTRWNLSAARPRLCVFRLPQKAQLK